MAESSTVLITRDREDGKPELEKYTEKEILHPRESEMFSVIYKAETDSGIKEEIEIEIDTGKIEKIYAIQLLCIHSLFTT